ALHPLLDVQRGRRVLALLLRPRRRARSDRPHRHPPAGVTADLRPLTATRRLDAPKTATRSTTMAAAMHRHYGPPEALEISRLPVPTPGAGQVLVRVAAAALNPADVFLMLGRPAPVRLMTGPRRPAAKHQVRGQDLAGTVEVVGAGVT